MNKQSNTRANKKQADKKRRTEKEKGKEKERANKTARVKWGGEENKRQMANNVMRGIRVCDGY